MQDNKKILVVSFQSLTKNSAGGMARLGYYLSDILHKQGVLKYFVVYSKGKHQTLFPSVPVSGIAKYYLFLLNKLNRFIKLPDHKFRLIQEYLYDVFCQKHITPDISILFTTNAHLKRTFKKAKKLGIKIIYVPANPEENYINELVSEEYKRLGISKVDPYTYKPRLDFYNESIVYVDKVVGTYPTVYRSYAATDKQYEVIHIDGHLKPDFKPYIYKDRPIGETLNVLYIATTVPLKGLQYLLHAWQELMLEPHADKLQLHIIGRIDPTLNKYFDKHFNNIKNVRFLGRVEDITPELTTKDVCVVPSLTDGGPYVALEAAHYGIPVILTDNCGSSELLSREPSGCMIIPIRDVEAIKKSINWIYNNRTEAKEMGKNAKKQLDNYSMEDFIAQLATYLQEELAKRSSMYE